MNMSIKWLEGLLGKHCRFERTATPEEFEQYETHSIGGEGIVVGFFYGEDGAVWVEVDYGMGWAITPDTTISFRPDGKEEL